METPWFESLPDRYQAERAGLASLAIEFSEDNDMKAKGILRLHLRIQGNNPHFDLPQKNTVYELTAVYPESYPWFRPTVYAYDLHLPRHQHMHGKALCLLGRETGAWDPTETLADLLSSQLDAVLFKGAIEDMGLVIADPEEQAEPYSEYYNVSPHSPVLFDHSQLPERDLPAAFGVIGKIKLGIQERSSFPCRMAVVSTTVFSRPLQNFQPNEAIRKMFAYKHIDGMLVETPEHPPFSDDPTDVLKWLQKGLRTAGTKFTPPNSNIRLDNGGLSYVVGITFPEELRKGTKGMGWIFLVVGSAREKEDKRLKEAYYLAKAAYMGPIVAKDRVPRLLPLVTKTVALCGLGALGSFVAIELARCGVGRLRLLDFDTVDPPTIVRWPLGLTAAGRLKTEVLATFIRENYPATHVEVFNHRIGLCAVDGKTEKLQNIPSDEAVMNAMLTDVDLVIDATAEEGITNYLTRKAVRRQRSHMVIYATPGAWGGVVMRWMTGTTQGCWNCMRHWQTEENSGMVPPVDYQGLIQPPGCGDLTFTGASFDLQQISTAAVRMAVSTLCSGEEGGYPAMEDDWAMLRLVDEQGRPVFPVWKSQKLMIHPNCGYCAKN